MSDSQSNLQTVSSEQFSENKLQEFKSQDFLSKFEGSWLQKRKGIGIKLKSAKNGEFYIRKYVTGTTFYKCLIIYTNYLYRCLPTTHHPMFYLIDQAH